MSKFTDSLVHNIMAGVPVLRVDTSEENRAVMEIQQVAWNMTKGKVFPLSDVQEKVLSQAFKKIGPPADGLLQDKKLSVNGQRLHDLLPDLDAKAASVVSEVIGKVGFKVITWDVVQGFSDSDPGKDDAFAENPRGALLASASPQRFQGHIIFVFKDCHPFLGDHGSGDDPCPRRVLRDIVETEGMVVRHGDDDDARVDRRTLVFLQPHWKPHPDIAHYFVQIDFDLPDREAIEREIDYAETSVQSGSANIHIPPEVRQQLRSTLTGLTQYEITNILGIAAVANKGFHGDTVHHVQRLKARTFEREQSLTWVDPDTITGMDHFAGFDNYLEWIRETREAYTEEAQAAGIKPDKGVLLLGIPGTGKSMAALATAKEMGLSLIKFDFSSIMASLVGQSEENMRRVLRRINAEGPCVLFIDEADKAFSNVTGPQAGSNVDSHTFGQLISWMANDNKNAFVIMTMNRLKGVPIELVRSGRISAIYYTTFPTAPEREEIFRLKLSDNGCDPDAYDASFYSELVKKSDQYVGAEIEEVVRKAVKTAWKRRKGVQPTAAELLASVARVKPVAALDAENIRMIDEFCQNKAEPVSSPREQSRRVVSRTKRSVDLGGESANN